MNNTSMCVHSSTYVATEDFLNWLISFVIAPLYVVLAFSFQILFLAALYRRSKTESAYFYQILVNSSEMMEVVTATFFFTVNLWNDFIPDFDSCYFWQLCKAHVATPLANAFITNSLLLSLVMAIDRIIALSRPFEYKIINHERLRRFACVCCLILSFSTSVFDCFRFRIITDKNNNYVVIKDWHFMSSVMGNVLAQLRNCLRFIALVALITANCLLVAAFRGRMRQLKTLFSWKLSKNEKERRRNERFLATITLYQCVFVCWGMTVLIGYYGLIYAFPNAVSCYASFLGSLADVIFVTAELGKCCLAVGLNREFRRIILKPVFSGDKKKP